MTSLKVRQELVFFKELEQLGKVSERESEFLFLMMDTDGDGLLHTERELKVRREKENRGSMYGLFFQIRPQPGASRQRGSLRKRLLRAFSSE